MTGIAMSASPVFLNRVSLSKDKALAPYRCFIYYIS